MTLDGIEQIEKPEPLKYVIFRKIKDAIVFNHLEQGEVLNERELAELFEVSRTPVRQALELLLMDGWVFRKGKSLFVNYLFYEVFEEMLPVRLDTEKLAMRLALPRITGGHLAIMERRLDGIHRHAVAIQDRNSERDKRNFLAAEKQFHLHFAEISENRHLYDVLNGYMELFLKFGMISLKFRDDSIVTHEELTRIYQSIRDRDLERACHVLEQQIQRGQEQAATCLQRESEYPWTASVITASSIGLSRSAP